MDMYEKNSVNKTMTYYMIFIDYSWEHISIQQWDGHTKYFTFDALRQFQELFAE